MFNEYKVSTIDYQIENDELKSIPADKRKRHHTIFVGEVNMNDLSKKLREKGIECTMKSGIIICDKGTVTIHRIRSDIPQYVIRGRLNRTFYDVRKILTDNFCVL